MASDPPFVSSDVSVTDRALVVSNPTFGLPLAGSDSVANPPLVDVDTPFEGSVGPDAPLSDDNSPLLCSGTSVVGWDSPPGCPEAPFSGRDSRAGAKDVETEIAPPPPPPPPPPSIAVLVDLYSRQQENITLATVHLLKDTLKVVVQHDSPHLVTPYFPSPSPGQRSLALPHLRTTRLESKGTSLRDPSVAAGLKIAHSLLGDGAVLAYFLSLFSRSIIW
ncbi:hypothetical protein E2C01_042639 [Portunus trituberculatus]|uniref:Uncharacterized protein n=1 Tax=Portunus trituberculatus TaxID=210409 RepID=A0A5B7FU40_PORTR|nr:hypothetical protein [Portunus trituberculatus]